MHCKAPVTSFPKTASQGLSLIELLVVLVIIGGLLAVALPMYNSVSLRSSRQVAIAELNQVVARQEQFLQEYKYYAPALDDLGFPGPRYGIDAGGDRVPDGATRQVYRISLSTVSSGFLVSAEPQWHQRKDTLCGTVSLQNDGRRYSSGSAPTEECW